MGLVGSYRNSTHDVFNCLLILIDLLIRISQEVGNATEYTYIKLTNRIIYWVQPQNNLLENIISDLTM